MFAQQQSLRLSAHEVASERFHNSQNENGVKYKKSDRMKFLVFVLTRGLSCCLSLDCVDKSRFFEFGITTFGNETACT